MAKCELLAGCLFFQGKMQIDSGLGALYSHRYCLGDSSECARYMVAKKCGREKVPENLYPNMYDRAQEIIRTNNRA